jgi:hypothetical protein
MAHANVVIDGVGEWWLSRLGVQGSLELPTNVERGERSIAYTLPARAGQGPDRWYRVRQHFELRLRPATRSGIVYVTASTNRRAAVMVELKVRRSRGRHPEVVWTSLDLVRGARRCTTRGRAVTVDVENYLQDRGVRPGDNVLTFVVERLGDVELERVRVLRDSGLRVVEESPAHLVLDAVLPAGPVAADERFAIGYELRNDGDLAAHNVGLGVESSSRALVSDGDAQLKLASLRGDDAYSGRFELRASRPGNFRVTLAAGAENADRPLVEIDVPVGPRRGERRDERVAEDERGNLA